jgi:cytochrome oxidase complex assembly protein 1
MQRAGSNVESSTLLPELLRFPHPRFAIESKLPLQDAVARIRGIVEQRSLMTAEYFPSEKLFAGEFSDDRFKVERILPLYEKGSPAIIEGRFEPTASGARLLIRMRPKRRDEVGVFIWFATGAALLLVCLLAPLLNPHIHGSVSFAMFMAMLLGGGYAMAAASFNLEIRKARELLDEALQMTPSERVREAQSEVAARRMLRFKRSLRTFAGAMALIIVGALVYPAVFAHTEQFQIARDYLEADVQLRNKIGAAISVEADRAHGYHSTSVVGGDGNCDFAVRVTGASGNGVVSVTMRKHQGQWKIASAQLRETDGHLVTLDPSD